MRVLYPMRAVHLRSRLCAAGNRPAAKKSPYREDTGVPDTSATLCLWQGIRLAESRLVPEFVDYALKTRA
jgi:hypothetical protein